MEANSSRANLTTRLSASRSVSHSHNLSSSSVSGSIASSISSRKSRHAEPVGTDVSVEPASLSMPPPPNPLKSPRLPFPHSRRESSTSEAWSEDFRPTAADDLAVHDYENTPKLQPSISHDAAAHRQLLSEPGIVSRSSFSENDGKRLSVSSLYSMASARGVSSSAASANGSESGVARSVSGVMASSKGLGPSPGQSESGLSNITVTTSSNSQTPMGMINHQLTPRDTMQTSPVDIVKRNPPPRSDPSVRSQPTRSRSRAKRRFSGSTANSSHSPSSERGLHGKEKEEIRPAPLGIIGVCALDAKARSKPSRNILNRLVANREFDVVVFGDKTILDEGKFAATW
jgi:inositol hexakisphosphate/diphosphoinositol-pentakisphosphate kinase